MLLAITTNHRPATDLGFLLAKHPGKAQSFDLAYGQAHVFYPRVDEAECTACLLLDIDPIGLVRGRDRRKSRAEGTLAQYVNDRAYVAPSCSSAHRGAANRALPAKISWGNGAAHASAC